MPQIARLVPPSVPVDVYMLLHSYIGRSVFSLFGVVPFRTLLDHRTTPHPKPPRTFRVRAENPAPPRMKPTPRTPRDAAPRVTPRLGAALHWTALVLGDLIQRPRRAEAGRAVSGQRFGDRSCRCLGPWCDVQRIAGVPGLCAALEDTYSTDYRVELDEDG